jgi:hypothetical protein
MIPPSELWAKWETLLGVSQGGSIAVSSMALLSCPGSRSSTALILQLASKCYFIGQAGCACTAFPHVGQYVSKGETTCPREHVWLASSAGA